MQSSDDLDAARTRFATAPKTRAAECGEARKNLMSCETDFTRVSLDYVCLCVCMYVCVCVCVRVRVRVCHDDRLSALCAFLSHNAYA